MKRVSVILSVVLVLMFAMASTSMAGGACGNAITNLEMKQFVKDVYGWELTKSCDKDSVNLPVGESVEAGYTVTATRIKEDTSCTVEISADVKKGIKKVTVTYGDESRSVNVKGGKIQETFTCQDGVNEATLKYKTGWKRFKVRKVKLSDASVFRESVNATATLQDQFGPLPGGLNVDFSGEYQPERELNDEEKDLYEFKYTVTVTNLSSYGETHTLENEATLLFEEGGPLVDTALLEIITPEKEPKELEPKIPERTDEKPEPEPEPELEPEPEPEPELEPEPLLPQTHGSHSVPGLLGVLMTAAGILIRRFK